MVHRYSRYTTEYSTTVWYSTVLWNSTGTVQVQYRYHYSTTVTVYLYYGMYRKKITVLQPYCTYTVRTTVHPLNVDNTGRDFYIVLSATLYKRVVSEN